MTTRSRLSLAAAALWVLPLWVVAFPPMVDYPQQLALSAILRWYSDPVRRFRETYELALWTPHGLFKLLTAGLAWVVPINLAGKLVVSASLLGVGLAALALCRRAGRPEWYALLALALTYNTVFYWGFVDNLLAIPLALGGVAMADALFERSIERPFSWRSWLALAGVCVLFYTVHLQFLLLFAGMVGWIALCRRPPWQRLALWLSALVPGVAAFAAMMAVLALPPPLPERRRLVAALVGVVVAFQFMQTLSAFLRFRGESAGLEELLAGTEPGQNLGGLIFERQSASWRGMPVYLHFPAYYQVEKGGRILFSFAELFHTSARLRPGKSWDDLLREVNDWNPQLFDYRRHGGRFRYYLVRGVPRAVLAAFGGDPARLGLNGKTAGEWWLFERPTPRP